MQPITGMNRSEHAAGMITLAHGAGSRKMHRLIRELFLRHFRNPVLARLEDAAELPLRHQRIALTTDSYVVQPLFFPGGDIGKLAVCGTVNDLAVKGAAPRWLSAGFIIGTGLELNVLEAVCRSMAQTARKAGVAIVTGDTKVIEAGSPELYINTAGIGVFRHRHLYGAEQVQPGDTVIISGTLGDHEAAIILARGEFDFRAPLKSDCAPLHRLIEELIQTRAAIKMMRDPTRGGVATTLNEIAGATGLGIVIDEAALPVRPEVQGVSSLLGIDPLYLANEGKVIVVVAARDAERLLAVMRRHPLGRRAALIAQITGERRGVWLKTRLGAFRPILMLEGQQLPRIC